MIETIVDAKKYRSRAAIARHLDEIDKKHLDRRLKLYPFWAELFFFDKETELKMALMVEE